jgi:hypothetical protein
MSFYRKGDNTLLDMPLQAIIQQFQSKIHLLAPEFAKGDAQAVREIAGSRKDFAGHNGNVLAHGIGAQAE